MTKIIELPLEQLTLARFEFQSCGSQPLEDISKALNMWAKFIAEHDHILKIQQKDLPVKATPDSLHNAREAGWCWRKANG